MTTNSGRFLTAPELEGATWRKSSYSGGSEGQCVEVAVLTDQDGTVRVRDSKDKSGPVLAFTSDAWTTLISVVRTGEVDFGVL